MSDVKVGDKIRFLETRIGEWEEGDVITVLRVDSDGDPRWGELGENWVSIGEYAILSDTPRVKVGDRIKLLSGTYFYNVVGDIVTVASIDGDGDPRFGQDNDDFAEPGDWELYSQAEDAAPSTFATQVDDVLASLGDTLKAKNAAYGDAALNPIRVFSKSDNIEGIRVRLDDKLSRLARGTNSGEDVILDLMGYLVLLTIAEASK